MIGLLHDLRRVASVVSRLDHVVQYNRGILKVRSEMILYQDDFELISCEL